MTTPDMPEGGTDLDLWTLIVGLRPAWHADAACAGTPIDLWFPERGSPTNAAKAICAQCDAIRDCLFDSLDRGERTGIRGGASERQRRHMRHLIIAGHDIDTVIDQHLDSFLALWRRHYG